MLILTKRCTDGLVVLVGVDIITLALKKVKRALERGIYRTASPSGFENALGGRQDNKVPTFARDLGRYLHLSTRFLLC